MLTERYEESLQSLEEARKLNPSNSEALNDIELVQMELNRANTDPNSVESATEQDPANKDSQENANMAAGMPGTVPEKTIEFPVAGEATIQ
jgi:hypothetical protein